MLPCARPFSSCCASMVSSPWMVPAEADLLPIGDLPLAILHHDLHELLHRVAVGVEAEFAGDALEAVGLGQRVADALAIEAPRSMAFASSITKS